MLLPENASMLAIFGNKLCVILDGDVRNAHETMHKLNHVKESHHSHEIVFQSIVMIHIIRDGLQEAYSGSSTHDNRCA
jgi:hypothetical protein